MTNATTKTANVTAKQIRDEKRQAVESHLLAILADGLPHAMNAGLETRVARQMARRGAIKIQKAAGMLFAKNA